MRRVRSALLALVALALLGGVPRTPPNRVGTVTIAVPQGPYLPESRLRVNVTGLYAPYRLDVLGPGSVEDSMYMVPDVHTPQTAVLVAAANGAIGIAQIDLAPAPPENEPLVAVASYNDGIVLHDARTFAIVGYVPIGGAPGDVAFGRDGTLASPDTDGDTLTAIERSPWHFSTVHGVPFGNEVLADLTTGAFFVSNRDVGGYGALTRVSGDGSVTRVRTGVTSEGLALDAHHGIIYVGNVNDASVTAVDTRTMRVLRRIPAVSRAFGLALDERSQRLYVVSNASRSMARGGGFVAVLDVASQHPRIVARSAHMSFPLGAALDAASGRLFVTDEADNVIYVLDAKTLRSAHAPLRTCDTPWRPHVDPAKHRLFVPCARSGMIDVYDDRTLRRVQHAPFATGGFPLGVSTWN
ncbi:MAG: YncE family protein [Vulcanimicrobiaceae bacterium]